MSWNTNVIFSKTLLKMKRAIKLRDQGLSYRKIGLRLGCTGESVRQSINKHGRVHAKRKEVEKQG